MHVPQFIFAYSEESVNMNKTNSKQQNNIQGSYFPLLYSHMSSTGQVYSVAHKLLEFCLAHDISSLHAFHGFSIFCSAIPVLSLNVKPQD